MIPLWNANGPTAHITATLHGSCQRHTNPKTLDGPRDQFSQVHIRVCKSSCRLDDVAGLLYPLKAMPKMRQAKPRGSGNRSKPVSFRVRLDGLVTPGELRTMLNDALDRIEALGATHLRGCYLYATPVDARGERVVLSEHGRPVGEIAIEPPYRSAADELGL